MTSSSRVFILQTNKKQTVCVQYDFVLRVFILQTNKKQTVCVRYDFVLGKKSIMLTIVTSTIT